VVVVRCGAVHAVVIRCALSLCLQLVRMCLWITCGYVYKLLTVWGWLWYIVLVLVRLVDVAIEG
jgi:hypothetical protein